MATAATIYFLHTKKCMGAAVFRSWMTCTSRLWTIASTICALFQFVYVVRWRDAKYFYSFPPKTSYFTYNKIKLLFA